jgi:arsenical pump membrane protein
LADAAVSKVHRPLVAFAPRLAIWAVVLAAITVGDVEQVVALMLVAMAGVVTIVSDARFAVERRVEEWGLPSREAWVPLVMMLLMLRLDLVDPGRIGSVVGEQGPVVVFILGFAVVAEGLRRSGFFHFLAYRLTERGGGNTTRLMLYLFVLTSLLTYFTAHDIVILTMTPIVLAVARQARMWNANLLLLSQFVAANTASMGLLNGSPANLVAARALHLGFVEHLALMLVPTVMAMMGMFVFVTWTSRLVERQPTRPRPLARLLARLTGTWRFSPTYVPPRFTDHGSFTPRMRRWVGIFALAVLLLAAGAGSSPGLLLAALATIAVTVRQLRHEALGEGTRPRELALRTLRILPWGIVLFALCYFVIADAVADEPAVREGAAEFVADRGSPHTPTTSWGAILGAGALVNLVNDLPASALTGEVLSQVQDDFTTPFDRVLVTQGLLVGLNIGTNVTPVGALAGIIWFDILRKERDRHRDPALTPATGEREPVELVLPERRDLIVYGSAAFLALAALLGATNFGFVALADMVTGPLDGGTEFGSGAGHTLWTGACLLLAGAVLLGFVRTLSSNGVSLGDLGQGFIRQRLWAALHRRPMEWLAAGLVLVAAATLLYHVESFHAREYAQAARFDGPGEFAGWLVVLLSSLESERFPRSALGNLLVFVLAVGGVAAVAALIRLSRGDEGPSDRGLRERVARGELALARTVVVNGRWNNVDLIEAVAADVRQRADLRLLRLAPVVHGPVEPLGDQDQ